VIGEKTMTARIVALGLLLAAQTGFAQSSGDGTEMSAAERSALMQALARGKQMKGSRDSYQHLPQVAAVVRATSSESPRQAVARSGEGGAQIIETKGRLVLYRSARQNRASAAGAGGTLVLPIVVNLRTGTLGVLTGALIVKPKSMADAATIARAHGLEVAKAYPQLKTVFYRSQAGGDIADASAALQADPRVESAYAEIIENVRVPM